MKLLARLRNAAGIDILIVLVGLVLVSVLERYLVLSVVSRVSYVAVAGFVLLLVVLANRRELRRAGLVSAAVVLGSTAIASIDCGPLKPFLRPLSAVQVGMSIEQVERIMAGYPRGTNWPENALRSNEEDELVLPHSIVFRPTEAPGDSNWAVITFEGGRVSDTRFSPD